MSKFNRKGYTTVRTREPGRATEQINHVAVRKGSKLERIARHKTKQMERAQKLRIREYKKQLREAKKRFPIEQRASLKLEDL